MLQQHKETGADLRPSRCWTFRFPEASRFGIMNCKPDGTIYEFEEKPKEPKSNAGFHGHLHFHLEKAAGIPHR